MQTIDQINRELREIFTKPDVLDMMPSWPWPKSPAPPPLPEFQAWDSWFLPEPPVTSTVTCQLTPAVQRAVDAVDAVQKIRAQRDQLLEACKMLVNLPETDGWAATLWRATARAIIREVEENT